MCDTHAQNFSVAGHQKTEERHASSIVPGLLGEGILESAAAFLENFEVVCRASRLLTCSCMLEAFDVCGDTAGGLRHSEDVRQIDCLDVVSCNKACQAHRYVGRHDEAEKLTEEMCAGGSTPTE